MKLLMSLKEAAPLVGFSADTLQICARGAHPNLPPLRTKWAANRYLVTPQMLQDWVDDLPEKVGGRS